MVIGEDEFYRQGDILFRRVPILPSKATLVESRVVAEGETTGHKHTLQGDAQLYRLEKYKYVNVKESATVLHDEHKPINLDQGTYVIIQEREFDPFSGNIVKEKQVAD